MAQKKSRKYKKVGCSTTEAGAKKQAKTLRNKGMTAQVRGKCVYSAGKRKAVKLKRTGQTLSGVKRRKRA